MVAVEGAVFLRTKEDAGCGEFEGEVVGRGPRGACKFPLPRLQTIMVFPDKFMLNSTNHFVPSLLIATPPASTLTPSGALIAPTR